MKATLPKTDVSNGRNLSRDKELVSYWEVLGMRQGKLQNVITVRCWMGRSNSASTVYASLWVRGKEVYYSGHGSAGGYGYHKESAAVDSAIRSAGIALHQEAAKRPADIAGAGDSAIRAALEAIARAAGVRNPLIVSGG